MKRLSFLILILTLTLQIQANIPEPKGLWEFNLSDPLSATAGAPLEIVGLAAKAPLWRKQRATIVKVDDQTVRIEVTTVELAHAHVLVRL